MPKAKPKRPPVVTSWKPGTTGNAAGRPPAPADRAEYLREVRSCTWGSLCALWDIVQDESADHGDRIRAASELLSRGWGNAAIAITGEDGGPLKIGADDALTELVRRLAGGASSPAEVHDAAQEGHVEGDEDKEHS